jgi:hypothetical protein
MSKHIFILGAVDKKLVIPLLLSIVYLILNIYEYYFPYNDSSMFIDYAGYSLGQISTIIIPKIFKIEKYNDEKGIKQNKRDYFFLILITFLLGVVDVVSLFFDDIDSPKLCSLEGGEIFIIFIMTSIFMKYKYYIHHIISLIIFIILGFVIDIMLKNIQYYEIESLLSQTLYAIIESAWYCYIKYMMDTKYYYYWEILFISGVTNLITYSLSFIILYSIKKTTNNPDIFINLDYFSKENIGNIIIRCFVKFIFYGVAYNILEMATLNKFSLNYIFACYELSKMPGIFIENETLLDWLSIIPALLQLIILLFYLEIFEYNFCNLNKNTKRNIQAREKTDNFEFIKDDTNTLIEMTPDYYVEYKEMK